ncbi:MAG: GNAT family N-acetyltransferase [Porticoccaceae bacterium]
MSIRNLDAFFRPGAIALIGASNAPGSVGERVLGNLIGAGFAGAILPVNPRRAVVHGIICYPDVAALPVVPDLAVIATPPATVPALLAELGARGTRAAVVLTAGFSADPAGSDSRQALLAAAQPHGLRLVGPNCLGILASGTGINASFAHLDARPGKLAFLTQSGAIVTSILDWAEAQGIGFSHLVSLGDMIDVDFGDLLDYLAGDPGTEAILLYVESVTNARKFISAARAAARVKPLIVVKAGRHAEGARAAASHTGALAGNDAVYDAVFRRIGALRVNTLEELFDAAAILATGRQPRGPRVAILTNGGGIGVLATDALIEQGGMLAELAPQTLAALNAKLPATWSHGNPVDIVGDAPGARYADAAAALAADPNVDAVLALNCPTAIASSEEAASALIQAWGGRTEPMLVTSWVGAAKAEPARKLFAAAGIPSYATPEQAVRAFMYLVEYRRRQALLTQVPPSVPEAFAPDRAGACGLVAAALADGRDWLTPPEVKALLTAYAIPTVGGGIAPTPAAAAAAARTLGGKVALKIVSAQIQHKSDVGGVVLDLSRPETVAAEATAMLERVRALRPEAHIDGFMVEPMAVRRDSWELIVGATQDAQFGPVLLFGQGGTAVEVVRDQSLELPPLNMHLAHALIDRTRVARLLHGYRDRAPADLDALALTLIKVAQLITDLAAVVELDINPLLADAKGVLALDARVHIAATTNGGPERLAIRPYPQELEATLALADGRELLLRPIRPEDEPALRQAFATLTPAQIRGHFAAATGALAQIDAARFTQIDYDREMTLILTLPGSAGRTPVYGLVRMFIDANREGAEFVIALHPDVTGQGLGQRLMQHGIAYARGRGLTELHGDVMRDNRAMRRLAAKLGFVEETSPRIPAAIRVRLAIANDDC